MKVNLIAVSSIVAVGAMMAGDANAQRPVGHMQEVRSVIAAEFEARGGAQIQAVGDLDTGYNPIEPCRVADTRVVDARLDNEETRNFAILGTDLSSQGGDPDGCNIPSDVSSVSLNVTVVAPSDNGFATVFPGDTPLPATASVNYTTGSIVGNNALIAVGDGVDIYSFAATDVVVDVTGYFANLAPNELDCFTTENEPDLAEAGEIFVGFTFCETGYTAVGGSCDQNAEMPMLSAGTFSEFGSHVCVFDNLSGGDAAAFVDVACCRITTEAAAE